MEETSSDFNDVSRREVRHLSDICVKMRAKVFTVRLKNEIITCTGCPKNDSTGTSRKWGNKVVFVSGFDSWEV